MDSFLPPGRPWHTHGVCGPEAFDARGVPGPAGGAPGRDGPHRPAPGGPGLSGGGLRAGPRWRIVCPADTPRTGRPLRRGDGMWWVAGEGVTARRRIWTGCWNASPACCPGGPLPGAPPGAPTPSGCSSGWTRSWSGPGTGTPPPIWGSHLTENRHHSCIIIVNGWISVLESSHFLAV